MGNCNFKSETHDDTSTLSKNNFQFNYVIGRGGFGKVWKVEQKKNKQVFALKEMSKCKIITKRSVNSVMNERQLLSNLKHNFIVNMICAFQDRENLYLVMDLLTGGDLRYHISRKRKFSEEQTKFFIACIVLSLEYVHCNGIIHRDIKPENLVFDNKGFLRLTDFGIARVWKPDNSSDTSGTPGYMAPEVMCRQNHGVAADYYAVGVIAYECMIGKRPYLGRNRKEIRDQILQKQVQIKKSDIPDGWSMEAADFVNRMIQRKPNNRLGLNGPEEVKTHPWLKDFPWNKLLNREYESPFVPSQNEDNFDYKAQNSDSRRDSNNTEVMQQNAMLLRRNSVQNLFLGYNFDYQNSLNANTSVTGNFSSKSNNNGLNSPLKIKSNLNNSNYFNNQSNASNINANNTSHFNTSQKINSSFLN